MLLAGFVHVCFFVEGDVAKLFFLNQTIRNGFADNFVNNFIKTVHFDIKYTSIVCIHLNGEDPNSSKRNFSLSKLD